MKQKLFLLGGLLTAYCFSQDAQETKRYTLDASQFYGAVLLHNPDISHLITNHPGGFILGYNQKTYGDKEWQQRYNYPDTGFSFVYQNMNNSTLGENYGLFAHYNFYFFKRNLQLRIGQGIAYNTNPFDKNQNFRNVAYGSHFLSATYLLFNYHKENVVKGLGFKAGIALIHYSNGNITAPNTSTNTMALNVGFTYDLDGGRQNTYVYNESLKQTEPVRFNLVFRSGINESDVVDSGQYPFYIFSSYADKRINRKSALQLGFDVYFSQFLKELIKYQAIAYPEYGVQEDVDYRRVGAFVGHELFVNKLSVITQLGYYVYYPFDFEGRTYSRIGLKRYFSNKVYGVLTLKSHGAKAEAIEFGVGIRL